MIESFRLPFRTDPVALKADLARLRSERWIAHFNTADYSGDWSGIALRAPRGTSDTIYPDPTAQPDDFRETQWMSRCLGVQNVLSLLQCEIGSVRLLRLAPGAIIKEHRDHTLSFELNEVRLHFPICTNEAVEFISNGVPIVMREGECWYINAGLPHSARNLGTTERVHLVVDCVVNEWLRSYFPAAAESDAASDGTRSVETAQDRRSLLALLEEMATPTARNLAAGLRERWGDLRTNADAPTSDVDTIVAFVRSIGIDVRFGSVGEDAVLPGIRIEHGGLVIDRDALLYPGDVLHEAGHLAVAPPEVRQTMDGALDPQKDFELAGELMTIPWTYAAALHIGISPAVVFHPHGYHGGSDSLLENFSSGRYIGLPALEWAGLTLTGSRADEAGTPPYPHMLRWMRE